MKYTKEQKQALKEKQRLNFRPFKKETKQICIQRLIDKHYPEPEKYEIFESKMNK